MMMKTFNSRYWQWRWKCLFPNTDNLDKHCKNCKCWKFQLLTMMIKIWKFPILTMMMKKTNSEYWKWWWKYQTPNSENHDKNMKIPITDKDDENITLNLQFRWLSCRRETGRFVRVKITCLQPDFWKMMKKDWKQFIKMKLSHKHWTGWFLANSNDKFS